MTGAETRTTRTTRTRSRDVESVLLEAAESVLVADGPEGLTVRAVAQQAGVAPMSVYNRFGSKDGLLDAMLVKAFTAFRAALEHAVLEPTLGDDSLARLRACGRAYRQFALANPRHYELMFEYRPTTGPPSAELESCGGAAFGVLVARVGAALAAGEFRPGDVRETAQLVWSAVHGAVSLELKGRTMSGDPARSYAEVLELIIDGLRPRPNGFQDGAPVRVP